MQLVNAVMAVQKIISGTAAEIIVAGESVKPVGTGFSPEVVVVLVALEEVIVIAAVQIIFARPSPQTIGPVAAADFIVSVLAVESVVSVAALHDVPVGRSGNYIVARVA